MIFVAIFVLIVVVFGAFVLVGNTHNDSATPPPTTPNNMSSTTAAPASAKGKPCVAAKGLPKGAPAVPVQVGPPPKKLVIKDLKVGSGAEVKADDTISADYIGVFCSTGKVLGSSYGGGQAIEGPVSQFIPGWIQGIPGMKVGGRRLLGIPYDLAYGAEGRPPNIAPYEALWFVVDVTKAAVTPTTTLPGG